MNSRIPPWAAKTGLTTALAAALTASSPAWSESAIPAPRQKELLYLLQQDCGSCHGLTLKGGLGSPLLPGNLADKPDEALVEIIMQGLPGTPMPPWRFLLKEKEAAFLVRAMKTGQTMKVEQ
ncbi:MAG: cytochrome c [Alphaproteobacteria bacterium]|jgi:cytochrome c55X|nr:cytochrome c [Alphaproteobacteria bacterium]MDP6830698.1 cytochrome c [Alphaproteobacteria bacterium]MDP6876345.1 cytochrome c [Alphaproteobacteria bacterium]